MGTGKKAIVLFSGGQDSTTCLYWAMYKYSASGVLALTILYGQRHALEVEAARKIAADAGVEHEVLNLGSDILKGTSPLIKSNDEAAALYKSADDLPGGIEPTFIPVRNMLFLTIAGNRAACNGADCCIVTGVCEEDYGGYPDCRRTFINDIEFVLGSGVYGMKQDQSHYIEIHTPLMGLKKRETVLLAREFEGCMEALTWSHTCYNGTYPPCGKCHACLLRARGFAEAGRTDPIYARPPVGR